MILHTYHKPDFDIVKSQTTLNKSEIYRMDDCFTKAYDWLFNKIKTRKVIWCYKPKAYVPRHGEEVKEWILNVPDDKIIAGIDIGYWNSVIMDHDILPDEVYAEWDREWNKLVKQKKAQHKDWKKFDEERLKEWRRIRGSKESQWHKYIPCKSLKKANEFLIPSPVPKKWVVRVNHFSGYDAKFEEFLYTSAFKTFDDAARYCTIVKSCLNGKKLPFKLHCECNGGAEKDFPYNVKVIRLWDESDS